MPVFRSGIGQAPDWCAMQFFEIVDLEPGDAHTFVRMGEREKIIVLEGRCRLEIAGIDTEDLVPDDPASVGTKRALDDRAGEFAIPVVYERTKVLRVCGCWGEGCGTFGIFTPAGRVPRRDPGDTFDYPKTNGIDRHYHDCDEYWIVYEGRGRAVSEGRFYDVGPGDCVATGMGHHHDFPVDYEPVKAVYFETDLEGQQRTGHLWEYRHGKAHPQPDRI